MPGRLCHRVIRRGLTLGHQFFLPQQRWRMPADNSFLLSPAAPDLWVSPKAPCLASSLPLCSRAFLPPNSLTNPYLAPQIHKLHCLPDIRTFQVPQALLISLPWSPQSPLPPPPRLRAIRDQTLSPAAASERECSGSSQTSRRICCTKQA